MVSVALTFAGTSITSLGSVPAPESGFVEVVGPASNGGFGVFAADMGKPTNLYLWNPGTQVFTKIEGPWDPLRRSGPTDYVAVVYSEPYRRGVLRTERTEVIDLRSGKVVGRFDLRPKSQAGACFNFGPHFVKGSNDAGFTFDAANRRRLSLTTRGRTASEVVWDTPKRRLAFILGQESGNYLEEYAPGTDRLIKRLKISEIEQGGNGILGSPDVGPFAFQQDFVGVGVESITLSFISKNLRLLGSGSRSRGKSSMTGKRIESWWLTMKSSASYGVGYADLRRGGKVVDRELVAVSASGNVIWRKRGFVDASPYPEPKRLYVVVRSGITTLDPKSGRQLARFAHLIGGTFRFLKQGQAVYSRIRNRRVEFFAVSLS